MIEELDQLNRGLERLVEERTLTLRQREEELLRRIFDLTPRSTTCRKRC
jgi:nitrate/nitrite-specific signal transduction histidine kinase